MPLHDQQLDEIAVKVAVGLCASLHHPITDFDQPLTDDIAYAAYAVAGALITVSQSIEKA